MKEFFKQLVRSYRRTLSRPSHPNVSRSLVENFDLIHTSANISNSTLNGHAIVGERCVLDDCNITANVEVSIGRNSILTGPIRIVSDMARIEIGKFCSIAPHVIIWESLHDQNRMSTFCIHLSIFGEGFGKDLVTKGPICIGNDVWIGARSLILSGVSIGDGAIIGAGSVVTKDVEPYMIVAGVPAKPIRSRFSPEISKRLQQLRWWDWKEETIRRRREIWSQEVTLDLLEGISSNGD